MSDDSAETAAPSAHDFIDTTKPHPDALVSADEIAAIARQAVEDVTRTTATSVGAALGTSPAPFTFEHPPHDVESPAPGEVESSPSAAQAASAPPEVEHAPPAIEHETQAPVPPPIWSEAPAEAPKPAADAYVAPAYASYAFEEELASDGDVATDAGGALRAAADYAAQNPFGLALVSLAVGIFVGMLLPVRRRKPYSESDLEEAA